MFQYLQPVTPVSYTHLDVYKRQVLDIHGHQCYFKFNRGVVIPFLGYPGAKGGIQEVACPDSARDHLTQSQQLSLIHI